MKKILDQIDFKNGKIHYNTLDLHIYKPLHNQLEDLKEDLLQVHYENKLVLDVGWYPEFHPNGRFVTYIIKNSDWENPVLKLESKSITKLINDINFAIQKITK